MKHPKSNICVDYIIEYSKAKSRAEEVKICKKYEDILFTHFENPDRLSEKDKRAGLNLCVAMSMFGRHPIFLGDYMLQLCEANADTLKNECYVSLATMENLGVVFEEKVQLFVWSDFLSSVDKNPALQYMSQTKASWINAITDPASEMLQNVLRELIDVLFLPDGPVKSKLMALKCLVNFCSVLGTPASLDVLVGIQGKCTDDDILFACCGEIPGLIEFVCDLIHRCTAGGPDESCLDPEDLKPLWNCGGCGGAASMSMATALCLDVAVHDLLALQTKDLGDFLLLSAKIVKYFSVLECINNFYKSDESILVFDAFTADDLKRLVQSENITYAAIQNIYDKFHIDRTHVAGTWDRVRLISPSDDEARAATEPHYGPDVTMRTHYAFAGLIVAATKYQSNAFSNYAFSKSLSDIDSDLGLPAVEEGAAFNLDFASKADLLWITDLSCLDSALLWLHTLLHNHDVNIRACGLVSVTELINKYDIVSMLRFISAMTESGVSDPKWKLCINRLIAMREKILHHLYHIEEYLLELLQKNKITDMNSIRYALDFLLLYGSLITPERAAAQGGAAKGPFEYIDCRLQSMLLAKAAESPESAAERGVASNSLEEEIRYYSIRRHEYVRALSLLSQKFYVISIAAMQRVAPRETLALFQVMNYEGTDRMTFSDVSSRRTFSMRQSISSVFNGDEVAAISLQTLWALPKPSTAISETDIREEDDSELSSHRDDVRMLLDLWHVSSSHKHLLGSVNSLSNNILKYWQTLDHDFAESLSLDCGNEAELVDRVDAPSTPPPTPPPKTPDDTPSAKPAASLLSPSFSFSSFSNLLNRYHVTVTTSEYLSIKCDTDGKIIFGQASGTLTVASKVNETAATKLSCNIRDATIFAGTAARDFVTTINVSHLTINEKYIRSSEANGLFFLTSQPGTNAEAEALQYTCSLTATKQKAPVQMLSECRASIVSGNAADFNSAVISGGEVSISIHFTFRFINTCDDRDVSDLIADIPLPHCQEVLSCSTESIVKGKIISKYDKAKRVLFARIPKLKRSSELILKAVIVLGGVVVGMLQNNTSVPLDKGRGFYLSAGPALLGFTLSNSTNDLLVDYHYSNIKFELPNKSSLGAQPGALTRSIASSTYINSLSRGMSGTIDDTANEVSAIEELLSTVMKDGGGYDDHADATTGVGSICVVTKDTLFDEATASGVPPPKKPAL